MRVKTYGLKIIYENCEVRTIKGLSRVALIRYRSFFYNQDDVVNIFAINENGTYSYL